MRLSRRLRRASRLGLAGWGLTALGGGTMAVLSLHADPATAGEATRATMTAAFAVSQTGLALVAVKVLHGLYQRAARIGDRRQR